jgi:uncharacterized flavoprotein (TIGR03862 family)
MERKKIIIIGGGPAALMAADVLARHCQVDIYEKAKTIGRKFLVAGKGGFNLSNSLTGPALLQQYHPAGFMDACLQAFDTEATRDWLAQLGIPTYVGTSGRVFPTPPIKPFEVLKALKNKLLSKGVLFHTQHTCVDFDQQQLSIDFQGHTSTIPFDYCIFALGGASWPVTGSDGSWTQMFTRKNINVMPFEASNCGIHIEWPEAFIRHHAGKPLKNIQLQIGIEVRRGEATITRYGLEGNAIYPLVPAIRQALNNAANPLLLLDLKPNNTLESLLEKAQIKPCTSKDYAQRFNLDTMELALVKNALDKNTFLDPLKFARALKQVPLYVHALRPVKEAISTVGGLDLQELNPDFSLRKYPQVYPIGEMLDWDAPTGGFLLQGCFSMGYFVGKSILTQAQTVAGMDLGIQ